MEERNKTKCAEVEERDPEFFVFTSKTKDADIPKETLTHLRVDSSVTEIPQYAFESCHALVHVQLPETLTIIGKSAFTKCYALKCVEVVSSSDESFATSLIDPNLEDGLILFPEGAKLVQIGEKAFSYCHSLRKVIVCSASTKLGIGVFQNCQGLISVELPEGFRLIEAYLFAGCEALTTVEMPSSVIKIGESAFRDCRGLKCIELPSTLERIEDFAFCQCTRLENIEFPSTLSAIGRQAFRCCHTLSHIRIPPSFEGGGFMEWCFDNCINLLSIEIPEGLWITEGTLFYRDACFDCPSFVNLAIPEMMMIATLGGRLRDTKLGNVVDSDADLNRKMKYRFENSPMNKLCYYHSYDHSSDDSMLRLRSLLKNDAKAATNQLDEFGMTPLHVLSLCQTPNLDMLLAVMGAGHLDHIIRCRDSFGSTPLDYLCLNRMPRSTDVIRRVFHSRFDYLLGLDRSWSSELLQAVEKALAVDFSCRRREVVTTYLKLAQYELKVVFSLLELRLWKSGGTSVVLADVLQFLDTIDVKVYFADSAD